MEVIVPTRAKAAYVLEEKTLKNGRKKKVKQEILLSNGMFSASEAEREMIKAAEDNGHSVDDIRVVPYEHGESPPMTTNPRHRVDHLPESWSGWGPGTLPKPYRTEVQDGD